MSVRASTEGEGAVAAHGAPLVEVEALTKCFPVERGLFRRSRASVRAVEDVTFAIRAGETLGLVGESGCGKSTTARLVLRLLEPTSGVVRFDGTDVTRVRKGALRRLRREMQMVFQDPSASLNPRHTVGQAIAAPLAIHRVRGSTEARVRELMERVGLDPTYVNRYPYEFSGGQRQRVGIARALALSPKLVVCDEPVSALDVSIQAQILNLLQGLQAELGLTYLFISHDLGVVRHVATRIAVMYLGRIVELGSAGQVCDEPRHPYTAALLSAVPRLRPPGDARARIVLPGEVPSATAPPPGCPFHPRCPRARSVAGGRGVPERCRTERPPLAASPGENAVACWYPLEPQSRPPAGVDDGC